MFICEINSVEANQTLLNRITPNDGRVVKFKSLPACIGFDDWQKYSEIRVIDKFEVGFGVVVPVVFAVDDAEIVDARVIVAEAL